jgi:hypothetical protein
VVMFADLQRSGYILVSVFAVYQSHCFEVPSIQLNEIILWDVRVSLSDGVSSKTDFCDLAAWIELFLFLTLIYGEDCGPCLW